MKQLRLFEKHISGNYSKSSHLIWKDKVEFVCFLYRKENTIETFLISMISVTSVVVFREQSDQILLLSVLS